MLLDVANFKISFTVFQVLQVPTLSRASRRVFFLGGGGRGGHIVNFQDSDRPLNRVNYSASRDIFQNLVLQRFKQPGVGGLNSGTSPELGSWGLRFCSILLKVSSRSIPLFKKSTVGTDKLKQPSPSQIT